LEVGIENQREGAVYMDSPWVYWVWSLQGSDACQELLLGCSSDLHCHWEEKFKN